MKKSVELVRSVSDGVLTFAEIARLTGLPYGRVSGVMQQNPDIPRRPKSAGSPSIKAKGAAVDKLVGPLSDGLRTRREIMELTGLSEGQVQKSLQRNPEWPRPNEGAQPWSRNHQYKTGRTIDQDGYALVRPDRPHPHARVSRGTLLEHRLVMERELGRYLHPHEVVDHIDGLTLHNAPENLRLFASNAEHLRATLSGRVPRWSPEGRLNIQLRYDQAEVVEPFDIRRLRVASGDVRLRQILLTALLLGSDSPYLLGSCHHTTKAGIDLSCRSTIERALDDLYQRWGWVRVR